jgi:hypothetical protein
MTAEQWLSCTDPTTMLDFLRTSGKLSDRKARLFAVAVCRRIWPLLTDERSWRAVEVAERFGNGKAILDELKEASMAAIEATWAVQDEQNAAWPVAPTCGVLPAAEAAEMSAYPLPDEGVWGANGGYGAWEAAVEAATYGVVAAVREQEQEHQSALLRCLFGNPFRSLPVLATSLLNSDVLAQANLAYAERKLPDGTLDPGRLATLADALAAAGCTDAELLGHLRSPDNHVRGCHGIDAVLGRS